MLLSLLLGLTVLTPSDAPPSLASIDGLEPSEIGDAVLRAREHRIIESVSPDRGMDPPGVVKLTLTELPSRISGGCVRGKWTATFRHKPNDAKSTAVLSNVYKSMEVSLATGSDCSDGQFAHLNPGLDIEGALNALKHLGEVRTGQGKVRFSCSDTTGSRLCQTPKMIPQELRRLPAWAVNRKDGNIELWLGEKGQAVTAVSYSETIPSEVSVTRSIPAPF